MCAQGYAFCEYSDMGATDFVIQSLNGKPVGNKFLTVKRALGPAHRPVRDAAEALGHAHARRAAPGPFTMALG